MRILNRIYVDFNNDDSKGRIRLITNGTINDLKIKNIELESGINLLLFNADDADDILEAIGTVEFSEEEKIWVAVINNWFPSKG
jgi:general stress protein 26